VHRISITGLAAVLLLSTACSQQVPAVSAGAASSVQTAPQQLAAAGAIAAPAVVAEVNQVDPAAVAKINAVCPSVLGGLQAVQACLSGGAAGQTGAVAQLLNIGTKSCGAAEQLAINDTLPVSPSNSGDSKAFLISLVDKAEAFAPIGCPIAKALIGK